ncbi:uncharacterized protein [Amphiura filiformis]|uniref:uncharacterized protein isoform X1 n=1 Tax=Amphiura filiformis TaxID=82378 RepID=UPI003B20B70F
MLASKNGHTETVTCLIEAKASLDIQSKDGMTVLHQACDTLSTRPNIRQIVALIEGGTNLEIVDKRGRKPVDCLQLKKDDEEYQPIKKALERREYKRLLETGTSPLKVVKLFLLGYPKAGKTTLKRALIKRKKEYAYTPTPGIDIGTYEVDDVGPLCIWDTAGHIEFHITHSLFLGSENAMAVVVCDLQESYQDDSAKLKYWLKFIVSGLSAGQKGKFKVLLVGTHMDQIHDSRRAKAVWQHFVTNIVREFGDVLDIETEPITVNGCVHNSKDMKSLRKCIGKAADKIRGTKKIPWLCEEIVKRREQWIASLKQPDRDKLDPNRQASNSFETPRGIIGRVRKLTTTRKRIRTNYCPLISYREFEARVTEFNPMASTDIIRIAANYLQDMGEIYLAIFESEEHCVVLNTQWLCFDIIGPTFAGNQFAGQLTRLPDKPFFGTTELEKYYQKEADFPTLELLLRSLDLMVKFASDQFIIFAKLESGNPLTLPKMKHMFGVCIFSSDKRMMFTPGLYPAVQARIMKRIKIEENRLPSITQRALKFAKKEEGLIELSSNKEIIKYVVGTNDDNLEKCYQDLEDVSAIIETALLEVSCGTTTQTGYLSHRELLMPDVPLEDVSYHTQDEIEAAEATDGFVYHQSKNTKENVSEILVTGFDTTFIRKFGIRCDMKWMRKDHKEEFMSEMDNDDRSLRQDYRSLADILGISNSKVKHLVRRCRDLQESVTESIIQEWRETTGEKMTFQMMLTLLHHPGLVANEAAARIIEKNLTDCDHKGPYPSCTIAIKIEENLVIWRAVLRKTYNEIAETIKPSKLTGLSQILTPQEREEIYVKEKREGRSVEATNILIGKLMALLDPRWPEIFLASLEKYYSQLAKELTKVHQCLKNDIFAPVAPIKIEFDQSAVPDIENYVKVCEAIQVLCSLCIPTVQECVEQWHQAQQQQMLPCLATAKCLPNKKPTTKSGACKPCIDWANAVESVCYPPCPPGKGVQWRNVNATLFHKDPVEVAKGFLFILPHGQSCTNFGDFDIGGILKLMMGFREFHNGDKACFDKMQKVVNIRNSLSHMSVNDNMGISDKQVGLRFDDIEDLVISLKTHQPNLKAGEIQSCLNQIRQSQVTTDMTTRALGPLSDSLIQALDDGMRENKTSIEDLCLQMNELCLQMNDIVQRLTNIEKTNSEKTALP